MSAGKVIENVIILGSIGAMGYLLFKKKPVIEQTPTTKTFIDGVEESEFKKKNAEYCWNIISTNNPSSVTFSPEYKEKCLSMQSLTELTEPLIDQSVLGSVPPLDNDKDLYLYGFSNHRKMYYTPTGNLRANTCIELDLLIKKLGDYNFNPTQYPVLYNFYTQLKADVDSKFNKFNCRDKIEAVRTRSLVDLQSKGSIKAEETILGKGFTEQKTYIILGALVLLTGFYVVVKK
jgi:hypothetical protein